MEDLINDTDRETVERAAEANGAEGAIARAVLALWRASKSAAAGVAVLEIRAQALEDAGQLGEVLADGADRGRRLDDADRAIVHRLAEMRPPEFLGHAKPAGDLDKAALARAALVLAERVAALEERAPGAGAYTVRLDDEVSVKLDGVTQIVGRVALLEEKAKHPPRSDAVVKKLEELVVRVQKLEEAQAKRARR